MAKIRESKKYGKNVKNVWILSLLKVKIERVFIREILVLKDKAIWGGLEMLVRILSCRKSVGGKGGNRSLSFVRTNRNINSRQKCILKELLRMTHGEQLAKMLITTTAT